jgi:hypothetical protein
MFLWVQHKECGPMKTEKKTFAFKLADKRQSRTKWAARDGVALAACTELPNGNYRDNILFPGGPNVGEDKGYFC